YCREGRPFNCPHRIPVNAGFSEYNVVPASVVYKLPPGVPPSLGVLAEPLSCAIHAVERGEIRPADSVAIIGAGALGLLVLAVARLRAVLTRAADSRLVHSDHRVSSPGRSSLHAGPLPAHHPPLRAPADPRSDRSRPHPSRHPRRGRPGISRGRAQTRITDRPLTST